jgi:hypothetical protein
LGLDLEDPGFGFDYDFGLRSAAEAVRAWFPCDLQINCCMIVYIILFLSISLLMSGNNKQALTAEEMFIPFGHTLPRVNDFNDNFWVDSFRKYSDKF